MRLDKRLWLSGRSPLGLRGLKYLLLHHRQVDYPSQPTRAAWIEIIKIVL